MLRNLFQPPCPSPRALCRPQTELESVVPGTSHNTQRGRLKDRKSCVVQIAADHKLIALLRHSEEHRINDNPCTTLFLESSSESASGYPLYLCKLLYLYIPSTDQCVPGLYLLVVGVYPFVRWLSPQ